MVLDSQLSLIKSTSDPIPELFNRIDTLNKQFHEEQLHHKSIQLSLEEILRHLPPIDTNRYSSETPLDELQRIDAFTMEVVTITVFTGDSDELRQWIDWMENRFVLDDYTELQKLHLAHGFIEGEAEAFVKWRQTLMLFQSWETMKNALLMRFGNRDNPAKQRLQMENERFFQEMIKRRKDNHESIPLIDSTQEEELLHKTDSIGATELIEAKLIHDVDEISYEMNDVEWCVGTIDSQVVSIIKEAENQRTELIPLAESAVTGQHIAHHLFDDFSQREINKKKQRKCLKAWKFKFKNRLRQRVFVQEKLWFTEPMDDIVQLGRFKFKHKAVKREKRPIQRLISAAKQFESTTIGTLTLTFAEAASRNSCCWFKWRKKKLLVLNRYKKTRLHGLSVGHLFTSNMCFEFPVPHEQAHGYVDVRNHLFSVLPPQLYFQLANKTGIIEQFIVYIPVMETMDVDGMSRFLQYVKLATSSRWLALPMSTDTQLKVLHTEFYRITKAYHCVELEIHRTTAHVWHRWKNKTELLQEVSGLILWTLVCFQFSNIVGLLGIPHWSIDEEVRDSYIKSCVDVVLVQPEQHLQVACLELSLEKELRAYIQGRLLFHNHWEMDQLGVRIEKDSHTSTLLCSKTERSLISMDAYSDGHVFDFDFWDTAWLEKILQWFNAGEGYKLMKEKMRSQIRRSSRDKGVYCSVWHCWKIKQLDIHNESSSYVGSISILLVSKGRLQLLHGGMTKQLLSQVRLLYSSQGGISYGGYKLVVRNGVKNRWFKFRNITSRSMILIWLLKHELEVGSTMEKWQSYSKLMLWGFARLLNDISIQAGFKHIMICKLLEQGIYMIRHKLEDKLS